MEKKMTSEGMAIQNNLILFSVKATGKTVGCLGYCVFDCTHSRDKVTDVRTIAALMNFDFLQSYPEFARILNGIDELFRAPYSCICKGRKPRDISHGFKTFIAPHMDKRSHVIYVPFLSIMRDYQMCGLGKQIMMYFMQHILKQYPGSIACWIVHAFNQNSEKNSMTDSDLERFYEKWGCMVAQDGSGFCYYDVTSLDLGFFKPQQKSSECDILQSKL